MICYLLSRLLINNEFGFYALSESNFPILILSYRISERFVSAGDQRTKFLRDFLSKIIH